MCPFEKLWMPKNAEVLNGQQIYRTDCLNYSVAQLEEAVELRLVGRNLSPRTRIELRGFVCVGCFGNRFYLYSKISPG